MVLFCETSLKIGTGGGVAVVPRSDGRLAMTLVSTIANFHHYFQVGGRAQKHRFILFRPHRAYWIPMAAILDL